MKVLQRVVLSLILFFIVVQYFSAFAVNSVVYAQAETVSQDTSLEQILKSIAPTEPIACGNSGCPNTPQDLGYTCADSYQDWKNNPESNFWVVDEEVTFLGKNAERARQFVYWVFDRDNIYNAEGVRKAWQNSRNVALAFAVLIVAASGLLIIISEKVYTPFKVEVRNVILKSAGMILFIIFSFTITVSILQISDVLMMFFIENMDVKSLFNIFFINPEGRVVLTESETAYKTFVGCKNLSTLADESVRVSMFLVNITNFTYFVLGIFVIIREIVLWFLIIVSPFLALLLYFRLVKNTGLIWIGVFFQWIFYGPLLALFLGSVSLIWKHGVPWVFNFSRVNTADGFVYPTGISILYGGPAQDLEFANSSNYVDTFAEYIISLLMLWGAIIFPWWLLRIFRDYCCEGIFALKNIVMSFYEKYTTKKPPKTPPAPTVQPKLSVSVPTPAKTSVESVIRISNLAEIKQLQTEKILEKMEIRTKTLQDIARFETNKEHREKVERVLTVLKQPDRVATPEERKTVLNIKNEFYNRAKQNDRLAQRVVQTTSRSIFEQQKLKEELVKTEPKIATLNISLASEVKLPERKVANVFNSFVNNIVNNNKMISKISERTSLPVEKTQQILSSTVVNLNQPVTKLTRIVSKSANVSETAVKQVINNISSTAVFSKAISNTASSVKVSKDEVLSVVNKLFSMFSELLEESRKTVSFTPVLNLSLTEKEKEIVNTFNNNLLEKHNVINQIVSSKPDLADQPVKVLSEFSNVLQTDGDLAPILTDKSKVEVLKEIYQEVEPSTDLVEKTAETANIEEEKVADTIESSLPLVVETDKEVEKAVVPPPTLPLEEYENTKKLWRDHYYKGEVPVSENIADRKTWIANDIVILTNTLNKLLSDDPKIREQGLDDVSYILPLFMLNDMKYDDILVYLKAKLEAAKEVSDLLHREEEIRQEVLAEVEDKQKVKVPVSKKKAQKVQEPLAMELEQDSDEDNLDSQVGDNQEESSVDNKENQQTNEQTIESNYQDEQTTKEKTTEEKTESDAVTDEVDDFGDEESRKLYEDIRSRKKDDESD
ncbi:MAG: hypothetical protein KatS3mg090_0046 [Patescibacteria group bacterium]|nr:MAG: hypothetical protein KatS3mg090_0046 [Patescibacteria group bacterium]